MKQKTENPWWSTYVCTGCACTSIGLTAHIWWLPFVACVLCVIGLRIAIDNAKIRTLEAPHDRTTNGKPTARTPTRKKPENKWRK